MGDPLERSDRRNRDGGHCFCRCHCWSIHGIEPHKDNGLARRHTYRGMGLRITSDRAKMDLSRNPGDLVHPIQTAIPTQGFVSAAGSLDFVY
jgi:hypothetical protein